MRVLLALLASLIFAAPAAPELPLGPPGLPESHMTRVLAPGLTEEDIVRGEPSADQRYVVNAGFFAARADADALVARLTADGFAPRVEAAANGFAVRVGDFATQAEATALQAQLAAKGYTDLHVDFTGDDGTVTTGPWRVHVLRVDPRRFRGRLAPELSNGIVPGRELVTALDARVGGLAAINGGYFVIGDADGTPGDLAGLSVIDGDLVSEAVEGRTDFLLRGNAARVAAVTGALGVRSSDGATRELDGRNRKPGLIRACGGVGGDQPTELPLHDITCTDPSELIQFTSEFGAQTQAGPGPQAVLDSHGRVVAVRDGDGAIPPDGSVLAGTGDAAGWLHAHATVGERVTVSIRLRAGGRPLALRRGLGIVNGGPRLLRDGATAIDAQAEGFDHPGDPEFLWRFGLRRNPRTIAGIGWDGTVILAAVDGRAPGYSVGLSFTEEAALMRALGARDAVNLDGGGSTALALGSTLLTRPSDATGERPTGDALVALPR
jgi:Phosphodiester glycosidase/SPOR domain